MADLFTSALSGMNAAQFGVATTEHNIANASTPGFTRQQMVLGSRAGQQTGGGFIGQGVDVTGVKRIYDEFLNTQVLQEQSQASYLSTYHSALTQIDNLVSDPAAGASPAMQGFFNALNAVANNPESIPARQSLLSNAQFAVNRFQAIDQRLTDIANGLTSQIATSVNTVNSYAKQIATLNGDIKRAIALGQGQQPNDLLDQRDLVISKLNQEIKTTTVQQSDGTVGVYIGTGQALVIGEQAMQLLTIQSPSDPSKVEVVYNNNGKTSSLQQGSLQGGKLGAYLAFRDQSLEPARNALGRVALGMAASINQQNQLGLDLNGALGGNLFTAAVPRVDKNANNNAASGIPSVTIADVSKLTTSDYRLSFDGANYTLLRLSDNTATNYAAAAFPVTVDGMTITAPAPVTAGDSFQIRPTANAARDIALLTNDPAKIATAAPMRAVSSLVPSNNGTGKISSGTISTVPLDVNVQQPVSIVFDNPPTTFTITGTGVGLPAAGVPYTAGANITYNGWTVQIAGAPVAGDSFLISANTNAIGDNRNALLMSNIQTQNLLGGNAASAAGQGTTSLQGAYGQLVGDVGAKTSELGVTSQAQDSMLAQTVASQQSVSGVNLDEEAANLMRYQKAYQAAAKAMQIAQTMFDAIMNIK